MLSWGLVLVEKEGWIAKEERHDKVADKVAAVPACVCVWLWCARSLACVVGGTRLVCSCAFPATFDSHFAPVFSPMHCPYLGSFALIL